MKTFFLIFTLLLTLLVSDLIAQKDSVQKSEKIIVESEKDSLKILELASRQRALEIKTLEEERSLDKLAMQQRQAEMKVQKIKFQVVFVLSLLLVLLLVALITKNRKLRQRITELESSSEFKAQSNK